MSNSISLSEFVNIYINNEQRPQNVPRLFKNMQDDNCYLFGKIFRKLIETAEENNIYTIGNYNYGFFDENTVDNNYIKLILFFRYKTPKQLSKYIKLIPDYDFFFQGYIKQFNNAYSKYITEKNNKYLLPPVLRKMERYKIYEIRNRIIENIGERYNINNDYTYWDVGKFIVETLDKKTVKDCISIKSKIKKEYNKNNKIIPKLQEEYDIFFNNNTDVDREYVLRELKINLENLICEFRTYPYKIRAINEYMEILNGNLP